MSRGTFDEDARGDPFLAEYEKARDVLRTPDWRRGLQEMEQLARSGSIMSILHLADAMRTGWGYDQDLPGAEAWYKVAVDSGLARGFSGLGHTHLAMGRFSEAIQDFEAAMARGFPPACNMLGNMYFNGEGVPVDWQKALQFWRKGASLGHLVARRNMVHQSLHGRFGFWRRVAAMVTLLPFVIEYSTVKVMTPYTDRLR